jgi:hypothetical protein
VPLELTLFAWPRTVAKTKCSDQRPVNSEQQTRPGPELVRSRGYLPPPLFNTSRSSYSYLTPEAPTHVLSQGKKRNRKRKRSGRRRGNRKKERNQPGKKTRNYKPLPLPLPLPLPCVIVQVYVTYIYTRNLNL